MSGGDDLQNALTKLNNAQVRGHAHLSVAEAAALIAYISRHGVSGAMVDKGLRRRKRRRLGGGESR